MTMTFEEALDALKNGYRVVRRSWQLYDPGSFICRQKGYPTGIPINENTAEATGLEEGTTMRFRPYLMVVLTDGSAMPWTPSQLDLFAEDWQILKD